MKKSIKFVKLIKLIMGKYYIRNFYKILIIQIINKKKKKILKTKHKINSFLQNKKNKFMKN